ncbi:MAG: hypothetical protein GY751_23175, partial [Bacteroidetes bacterium]|nr:hypothetical protein [Bacteroidota bacterium]
YCSSDASFSLPTTSDNGISGSWTPASVNPATDGPTANATFTPSGSDCASSVSATINISEEIIPAFSFQTDYCSSDASFSLPATSDNGISGSWTPASVNPATDGPTVNATFTPSGSDCANSVSVTINISEEITPDFSFQTDYCSSDASFSLPTTSDNGIPGSWSPASVNPATDGPIVNAIFTPSGSDCASTVSVTIIISEEIIPAFSFQTDYCSSDASFSLPTTSDNGIPGSWSPASVNPATDGPTVNAIFALFGSGCADSVSITINISEEIIPDFSFSTIVCETDDPIALPSVSDNGVQGYWGVGEFFDPDDLGGTIQELTFTPNMDCALLAIMYIDVENAPFAGLAGTLTICNDDNSVDLTTPLGSEQDLDGFWSDDDDSGVLLNNPSNVDFTGILSGSYQFTYFVEGSAYCPSSSAIVTVDITDGVNAGEDGFATICNDGSSLDFFNNLEANPNPGGSWTDNDNSGVFLNNPSGVSFLNIPQGVYTFNYFLDGGGNCPDASSILSVTVLNAPDAGMDAMIRICSDGFPVNFVESLGGTPDEGGIWVDDNSVGVSLDDPTSVDFSSVAQGEYTFTYAVFGNGDCDYATSMITVQVSNMDKSCSQLSPASSESSSDGIGAVTIIDGYPPFSLNLEGPVTENFNNLSSGTHTIESLQIGTYQITIEDANACRNICEFTIESQDCEDVSSDLQLTLCEGESIAVNGTTYDQTNPSGSEAFVGGSVNGCDSIVHINLSFFETPFFVLDASLCENDQMLINGVIYDQINPTGTEILEGQAATGCDSIVNINQI